MSLYVLSDAPIVEVVNLLLQEPYTENTIAYNDDPEAYDVRSVDGVLISMDYGDSAYGPVLDTLIFVPDEEEELQRKIFNLLRSCVIKRRFACPGLVKKLLMCQTPHYLLCLLRLSAKPIF